MSSSEQKSSGARHEKSVTPLKRFPSITEGDEAEEDEDEDEDDEHSDDDDFVFTSPAFDRMVAEVEADHAQAASRETFGSMESRSVTIESQPQSLPKY